MCGAYTFRKNAKGCLTVKTIPQKLAALALVCALTVSLAGCGVNVTGVALDLPDSMEKGTTLTAVPAYTFDGATPESAALAKKLEMLDMHYTSSDPAVVMVDESGCLAALRAGTAEVTLSSRDGTITASKTIEVVVTPTGITTTDALTLTAGEAATLETAVAPDDATHVTIRYTSSDNAIATVSDAGEVTAVTAGEADITAAVDGTALAAVCHVTVNNVDTEDETEAESDAETTNAADSSDGDVSDSSSVLPEVSDAGQAQESAPAASSSFEYGALPMDPATDGETWWNIDSSDSAYWAVANNINAMRAEGGLPALTVSDSLSSIAHDRCVYLIANDIFSHDGATTAEILCSGATSASAACTGWRNSPGHYANIMTPGYTQMGIACTFNTAYGVELWCVTFS